MDGEEDDVLGWTNQLVKGDADEWPGRRRTDPRTYAGRKIASPELTVTPLMEVIPTSDDEELELERAKDQSYWMAIAVDSRLGADLGDPRGYGTDGRQEENVEESDDELLLGRGLDTTSKNAGRKGEGDAIEVGMGIGVDGGLELKINPQDLPTASPKFAFPLTTFALQERPLPQPGSTQNEGSPAPTSTPNITSNDILITPNPTPRAISGQHSQDDGIGFDHLAKDQYERILDVEAASDVGQLGVTGMLQGERSRTPEDDSDVAMVLRDITKTTTSPTNVIIPTSEEIPEPSQDVDMGFNEDIQINFADQAIRQSVTPTLNRRTSSASTPRLDGRSPLLRRERTSSLSSLSPPPDEVPLPSLSSLAPLPVLLNPSPDPVVQPEPQHRIDHALQAFQRARTFRTRTAIQLQPYTREKKIYTAAIRRGGKRLIEELLTYEPEPEVPTSQNEESFRENGEDLDQDVEEDMEIDMAVSPPVQPEDHDYDEYFLRFGEVAEGDEDERLQEITKNRQRNEETARKAKAKEERQARKVEKELQREIKERERVEREEKRRQRRVEREAKERIAAARREARVGVQSGDVEARSSRAGSVASDQNRPTAKRKRKTPRPDSPSSRPAFQSSTPVNDLGGFLATDEDASTSISNSIRSSSVRPTGRRHATIISSDEEDTPDAENSLLPSAAPRKKGKALERMLPAFMIRRLAKDAERPYAHRRPLDENANSSNRPGQARPKKRVRPADEEDDLRNFFVDESGVESVQPFNYGDDDEEMGDTHVPYAEFTDLISLSSSSTSEDSAPSDNESIQDLVRGDFERVLLGPRPRIRQPIASKRVHPLRQAHRAPSRSASPEPPRRQGQLRQMRLNFGSSTKRRPGPGTGLRSKPPHRRQRRIVLDDDSIFEYQQAPETDEPEEQAIQHSSLIQADRARPVTPQRPGPRLAKRSRAPAILRGVPAIKSPAGIARGEVSDTPHTDVEHAKIWSSIKQFQLDFALTPLPSELHLVGQDFPTLDDLRSLKTILERTPVPWSESETIEAYGVVLQSSLPPDGLESVLPLLFEGMRKGALGTDDECWGLSDLGKSNRYLVAYMGSDDHIRDQTLAKALIEGVNKLAPVLEAAVVPRQCEQSFLALAILRGCWAALALVVIAEADGMLLAGNPTALVETQAKLLIRKLLEYGIHRTMRPLKAIMAHQADSSEVDDLSVRLWVFLIDLLGAGDLAVTSASAPNGSTVFDRLLLATIDDVYPKTQTGPIASEKLWYLTFGISVLKQFDVDGKTGDVLLPKPVWSLVQRAIQAVKVRPLNEATELRLRHDLRMRDRYIKIMVARCLKLITVWQWHCDRDNFYMATRDLGTIFKERSHRNFPNEEAGDYPTFLSAYDLGLTEQLDLDDSTYNLYLRLICLTASDMVGMATSVTTAEHVVRDVQRLMMSIFPFSPVPFSKDSPPTNRQLAMLINRYSTLIVSNIFVPSLSDWLLANASKWLDFQRADLASRNIIVRGVMYFAIACRHHNTSVRSPVEQLATMFGTLMEELSALATADPKHVEIQRSLVLIIGSFRHIITHHSFEVTKQETPSYPDPVLMHPCWIDRLSSPDLVTDRRSGNEIVSCIQAFLDERAAALPDAVKRTRAARLEDDSQNSEFGSMGLTFSDVDLLALGGEIPPHEPELAMDAEFAGIVLRKISPGIYHLLSNMFSGDEAGTLDSRDRADRQVYISKLTKCWADCASVVVVDHRLRDWSTYVGHGIESWTRLGDDHGRRQVGMNFMLNVARLDPNAFEAYSEDFVSLLFQIIVSDSITVEHQYMSALERMPGANSHPLLEDVFPPEQHDLDRGEFQRQRMGIMQGLFRNIPKVLRATYIPSNVKALAYACVTKLLAAMDLNYRLISAHKWDQRRQYSAFCEEVVETLKDLAGSHITSDSVPKLKEFPLDAVTGGMT